MIRFKLTPYPLLISFALFTLTLLAISVPSVSALSIFNYTDHPMDDSVFRSSGAMTVSGIQAFLISQGSGLSNFSDVEDCGSVSGSHYSYYATYYKCGSTQQASKIIYDASQAYGINPQVILATLQKEQSLVTTPNPTSSQLNYAMGYGCPDSGGCSYPGFFNQVDNGAWQFRFDYERLYGNSTWWNSSSTYPCNVSSKYYNQPLVQGNDVTFFDDHGIGYTHFVIPNAATATLYCYTPHVYPGSSQQYYSGSYWFVYYYNLWFIAYLWSYQGQNSYMDSAMTIPYTAGGGTISITPGSKAYLHIKAQNNGYETWTPDVERLGVTNPQSRCSQFADSSWISCQRIVMSNSSVAPGNNADYIFSLTAPTTTGAYKECFSVVADGITWLNDPGICLNINVTSVQADTNIINTGLASGAQITAGQYLMSPDSHTVIGLQLDGNLVMYKDYTFKWATGSNGTSPGILIMQADGNLVLYNNAGKPVWASNTFGNPGAHLAMQADGNAVIYSSSGVALWATGTNQLPLGSYYVNQILNNSPIYPQQELATPNRNYRLILQLDGNLVLYSPTKPIWATGTNGKQVSYAFMQADGNLVLYNNAGKPVWASNTNGPGSRLLMQNDGNLVLYNNAGKPVWASNTINIP